MPKMKDRTFTLEVPLPTASRSGDYTGHRLSRIAFHLTANQTLPLREEFMWYLGWHLVQMIYLHGLYGMWEGMHDFLVAHEWLRNKKAPCLEQRAVFDEWQLEIFRFYNYVRQILADEPPQLMGGTYVEDRELYGIERVGEV